MTMKAAIFGSAVLALLPGNCFAQTSLETNSGAAPNAATQSKYKNPPPRSGPVRASDVSEAASTSKLVFHSRPSGAKITLPDGKSCTAPCSITVGYNEKFTATAAKRGYLSKEFRVEPQVTNLGRAQIIGSAIGAGVVGLVVGAAMADRAYGPEPIVVELEQDPTSPHAQVYVAKQMRGWPQTSGESARIACTMQGCLEVKAGCRVIQRSNVSSAAAGGGQGETVVCN